jgi:hypothetical protein
LAQVAAQLLGAQAGSIEGGGWLQGHKCAPIALNTRGMRKR